jgi:hypothetical protein
MTSTAVETEIMISFVLPRDPRQVAMTRCLIRAALEHRGLGSYADDAASIASELVTNASAPRGALSYPRCSRDELEGGSWV